MNGKELLSVVGSYSDFEQPTGVSYILLTSSKAFPPQRQEDDFDTRYSQKSLSPSKPWCTSQAAPSYTQQQLVPTREVGP